MERRFIGAFLLGPAKSDLAEISIGGLRIGWRFGNRLLRLNSHSNICTIFIKPFPLLSDSLKISERKVRNKLRKSSKDTETEAQE